MTKVYGYVRISEEDQNKGTSIENQKELIQNLCIQKQWQLMNIYEDRNLSGSDRFRKGFTDMIRMAIKELEIKIIIVKDQSRFARDSAFFMDTLKDLEANGVRVFSIMKSDFLLSDDLADAITSITDAHYIVKQRQYTKRLYQTKKEEGMPPFRAPFGYDNKKSRWMINPKQSRIVERVCVDYATNINPKETIENLQIKKSLYYRIIRNCVKGIYSGFVSYVNKIKDSNGKIVRTEPVKYQGHHKPIIFEEIFKKVKEKYDRQLDKENFKAIRMQKGTRKIE